MRFEKIEGAIEEILKDNANQFVTFFLRARGPKRLKSALLRLASGAVENEDTDLIAPLALRKSGQGFAWKKGKGVNAEVLLRVPKDDVKGWTRTLVSMEAEPSNSRVEILSVRGEKEFFSKNEVDVLKNQRTEEQLEVIKLMTEERSRFMIIPSAPVDHSDNSSGDDYLISIASDSDRDLDSLSHTVSDVIRDRDSTKPARLYRVVHERLKSHALQVRVLEKELEAERAERESMERELERVRSELERLKNAENGLR